MKLAEALILRADSYKRIEQLRTRLKRNAKTQEGDAPAENPGELVSEFEAIARELEKLIQRINRTNSSTDLHKGVTIADALATRDLLRLKREVFAELAQAASIYQDRHTRSEVRFKSAVDVAKMQKQADGFAKLHRELDSQIQEANWKTDLPE